MKNFWMFWRFLFACVLIHLPQSLAAETLFSMEGQIGSVEAGYFCLRPPDDIVPAPNSSTGELNVFNAPFPFVQLGDTVPSIPGIGIGIIVRMQDFRVGEELTVTAAHGAPCCRKIESWRAEPNENGLTWLGYLGEDRKNFQPGEWRFSILRGQTTLLIYNFHVLSAFELPSQDYFCSKLAS